MAHARADSGCVQGERGASAAAADELLGSAETAVLASCLRRRSLEQSPPGERPPIVFLCGEGAELLRIGPWGISGRRTVRVQLSWRSWGKFCDLRRGRGGGAPAPPLQPLLGAGEGKRDRGGGEGALERAGGDEWAVAERLRPTPRLCGPLLPPRPTSRIVCLLATARVAGRQPNFGGVPHILPDLDP